MFGPRPVWVLDAHDDTREMCAEFLRVDGLEVVSFECPQDLTRVMAGGPPQVALVDAWSVASSESLVLERVPTGRIIVTSTTLRLARLWRRLGAARVRMKPIWIDEIRDDVRVLARGDCASVGFAH